MIDFIKRGFGLKRDTKDRRDRALFKDFVNIDSLPKAASNLKILPRADLDQLNTGSCVGYSGVINMFATMKRDGHKSPALLSPVFLYRQARLIGGYVEEDGGAEIRNAWKAANLYGVPLMSKLKPRFLSGDIAHQSNMIFPENSIWRKEPIKSVFTDALNRQSIQYFRLIGLGDILKCIADGFTAQLGFTVFESFYDNSGPRFEIPEPRPERGDQELGGHAVTAYAYDIPSRRVLFRNQWGTMAHKGKPDFTLSFDYLNKYASDVWTCRLIEGGKISSIVPPPGPEPLKPPPAVAP